MSHSARQRIGSTLVELMTVMFISFSLMGVLVTLISRVVRTNGTFGEHLEDSTALGQLSEQFRRDVHGAANVSLEGDEHPAARLLLKLADGSQIEYDLAEGALIRTSIGADGEKRPETFVLHNLKILGWKQSSPDARDVSMLIDRVDPSEQIARGRPIEITAAIVRDRRLPGGTQ